MLRTVVPPIARLRACSRLLLALAVIGSLLASSAAAAGNVQNGAALGESGVTLGESATIDAEVFGVPPEPELRERIGAVAARSPDGDLVARLRLSLDGERVVLQGELPSLTGSPLLAPITSEELWPCPVEVDRRANFLPTRFDAEGLGMLILGTEPPHPQPLPGELTLVLVYADQTVSVRASCDVDPRPQLEIDLQLQPGWNLLASELLRDAEGERLLLRTATDDEIARARWYAFTTAPVAPDRLELEPREDQD